MFSARIISFFFLLATFGFFACAKPVTFEGVAARASAPEVVARASELLVRGGTCDSKGCNEDAILAVLLALQVKVEAQVKLLDGINIAPCTTIIADINAAVQLLLQIDVNLSVYGSKCKSILSIIVNILVSIAGALSKYNPLVIIAICLKLDLCLCAFVHVCITLIPGLLALITAALKVDVNLFLKLKLVLTLAACGLGL